MFDEEQAAEIAGCHSKTIKAHIERYVKDSNDHYGNRCLNKPGSKQRTYGTDLKDYLERTLIGAMVVVKN